MSVSVSAPTVWNHPLPLDIYDRLAQCETQHNTQHETRSYVGAFGFARGTFELFADTPAAKAKTLTFAQQARILDRAFFYGHTEPNGKHNWAVGPFGHGCWKMMWANDSRLRNLVCNNHKQQVRRWCRPLKRKP